MINIIGLGYIGLPTGLVLAANDCVVVGTDYNKTLIDTLNDGKVTFEEEGLVELYHSAIEKGITFSQEYMETDTYIVTVPTPYMKETKKIDPTYVILAVEKIIEVCLMETIIILESTVSPGTIDTYIRPLLTKSTKKIQIVHAPERILPGKMIDELKNNPRTIGADTFEIGYKVKEIYQSFCQSEITLTDIRTAEMSKVVENTFRDINIAFANELAKICRADEMDVYEIIKIANKHPRVNILNPGPGVGGHCISVDPWFLVGDYPDLTKLISTARKVNDTMPDFILKRIHDVMKENNMTDLSRVGLYGLTYKPDVDDCRESPTLQLVEKMSNHLASPLKIYDPMIQQEITPNQYVDFDGFLDQVDLVVVMVSHTHLKKQLSKLTNKLILDTQNILPDAYKI